MLNSPLSFADTVSMKRYVFILLIITCITAISVAQAAETGSFRQEGIASWYGKEFDGKPTASGEVFDSDNFTAAHPTLPFGTILRITNKQNNRQVTVRVNDRGPFVAARIVDLSRAAAEVLDMIATGTAPVILEQAAEGAVSTAELANSTQELSEAPPVEPITQEPKVSDPVQTVPVQASVQTSSVQTAPAFYPAPPAVIKGSLPPAESARLYRLQVGAYKIPRNASDAFDKLKKAGLNPAYEQNGEYYRVVLAGLTAREIQSIAQTLGNAGFREAVIREEH